MLGTMKEIFGIVHIGDNEEEVSNAKRMHIVEEAVPVPHGPSIVVSLKGRECLVMIDDNGPVPPLVSSSPSFFLKNTGDSSRPFFTKMW
jgi:hypothetical protein